MIKGYAKQELKQSYWLSFAVCLVAGILGAGGVGTSFNFGGFGGASDFSFGNSDFSGLGFDYGMLAILVGIIAGALFFLILFALAFSIFVANPIEAGKCSFFFRASQGERQFTNLFSSFKSGGYISIVKAMFFRNLFIFLWSLLFIIPGIIKAYQYRMVAYIISEDPSLSPNRAMERSRTMTDGEKWAMFVLDLSFLGWYLLGLLACGVGVLFVRPYVEATWAQLYVLLKAKTAPPKDVVYN